MTDKTLDSTQPGSDAQVEDLTIVRPGGRDHIQTEEADRNDPPVADLARELPEDIKDANRLEGDWSGDGDENHADAAEALTEGFDEDT